MITYKTGSHELLEVIRPLWEALNTMHAKKSKHFKERFQHFNYDMRLNSFKNAHQLFVTLAYDDEVCVGYSIATLAENKIGEIESLFLKETYRGKRIGETLMEEPLNWMEKNQVKRTKLGVGIGNEEAFHFYEKFGFYPKVTILERK